MRRERGRESSVRIRGHGHEQQIIRCARLRDIRRHPREMRRAWMTGFGNARLAGCDEVRTEHLPSAANRRGRIGFTH